MVEELQVAVLEPGAVMLEGVNFNSQLSFSIGLIVKEALQGEPATPEPFFTVRVANSGPAGLNLNGPQDEFEVATSPLQLVSPVATRKAEVALVEDHFK